MPLTLFQKEVLHKAAELAKESRKRHRQIVGQVVLGDGVTPHCTIGQALTLLGERNLYSVPYERFNDLFGVDPDKVYVLNDQQRWSELHRRIDEEW